MSEQAETASAVVKAFAVSAMSIFDIALKAMNESADAVMKKVHEDRVSKLRARLLAGERLKLSRMRAYLQMYEASQAEIAEELNMRSATLRLCTKSEWALF